MEPFYLTHIWDSNRSYNSGQYVSNSQVKSTSTEIDRLV